MPGFWYQSGGIPDAIRLSKQQSKLFLVYIAGSDDSSRLMNEYWNDSRVVSLCEKSCISLKLQENSESCNQFSAIYPVLCVPSAYFIDNAGKLVKALVMQSSTDEFVEKVKNVTKSYLPKEEADNSDNISIAGTAIATDSPKKRQKDQSISECGNQSSVVTDSIGKGDDSCNQNASEHAKSRSDQKVTKPKEQIQPKKSSEVAEQLKQYRSSVSKEFEKEAEDEESRAEQEKLKQQKAMVKESEEKRAKRQSQSRLQFRMPDGDVLIKTFRSDEVLLSAISFIKSVNYPALENRSFTLSQVIPRKSFVTEDYPKTFQELDMVPGASLVVIPVKDEVNSTAATLITKLLSLLMVILMLPYRIIAELWNFISTPTQSSTNTATSPESNHPHTGSTAHRSGNDNQNVRRRQVGKMARLSDTANDDDDNATWNGNSTQQM